MHQHYGPRYFLFLGLLLLLVMIPAAVLVHPHSAALKSVQAGWVAAAAGDYVLAARRLAEVAGDYPNRADYWNLAAQFAIQADEPDLALNYLEKTASLEPPNPKDWADLGDSFARVGKMSRAADAWAAALKQGAPSEELLKKLLKFHRSARDYEAAVNDLQGLIDIDPSNPEFQLDLGLLMAATDPDQAVDILGGLEALDPTTARVGREVSLAIRRAQAISEEPAYISLISGRALAAAGSWDLAELAFQRAVDAAPDYAEAWAFLGESRLMLEEDAKEAMLTAFNLDPQSLAVNLLSALYWQSEGDHEQAMFHLDLALGADPTNPTLIAEMGSITAAAGDIPGALSLFDQAIQADAQDATYWKLLANFSIENNIQVETIAVDAARQATLLDPQDPAAFDLLGQAYMALGNPLLAERFLTQAISLNPDFTPAVFHLGLVFLATGSSGDAHVQFDRVIALSPDSFLANMAAQLLQEFSP